MTNQQTKKLSFTDRFYNFQYHFQNTKVVSRTGHTLNRTREKKSGIAALFEISGLRGPCRLGCRG